MMNKRRALPIALLAVALAGCVTYKTRSDGITRLRLGETASVDGPKVTPLRVVSDSRCPSNVQCVWAGELRVEVKVAIGSGATTRELVLGQPEAVADGKLELVEGLPYPRHGEPIYPEDYRFGFTFQGGL